MRKELPKEVIVILSKKDQQLKLSEADRGNLVGKVHSLEVQCKNFRNQNKKLERQKGQILKLLLLERNKVRGLEEEISILKMEDMNTVQDDIDKEIESSIEDDDSDTEEPNRGNPDVTPKSSDEQAKDDDSDGVEEMESEDESDEEESTRDNERVIVKKEVTSDNEDEAGEISDADISPGSPTPAKRTGEKLQTETEAEEDEEEGDDDGDNREGDKEDLEDLLATATEKITNI